MNFDQWRAKFFNVDVSNVTNPNSVIGQVHSGHPHGVPRIHQGLRLRTYQPHEVGFINSNSNINKRYQDGVDTGNFQVTTPQLPQVHNDLRHPVAIANVAQTFATPSTRTIQVPVLNSKPGISGGGSGVQK